MNPLPEIWVAAGTYYGDGTSTNAFRMAVGVNVYGGFAGTETSLQQRDYETNITILDGQGTQRVLYQDKVYTESTATVWDGITIQNGGGAYNGAGAYIQEYGTLRNCTIKNNGREFTSSGRVYGGGVYLVGGRLEQCKIHDNLLKNTSSSSIYGAGVYMTNGYITDCEIYNNEVHNTYYPSYGSTAGVYVDNNSSTKKAVIENCYVHDNYSHSNAGGMYLDGYNSSNHVEVINCRIENNYSEQYGGGVYVSENATFIGCNISNNTANESGAGMHTSYRVNIINCNIVNNHINSNYQYYNGSGIYGSSYTNVYNSIIWGNKKGESTADQIFFNGNIDVVVSYSAIEGGYAGTGNISLSSENDGESADIMYPKFMSPTVGAGKDYSNGDWTLEEGSACINNGTNDVTVVVLPETDLAGNERIQKNTIDVGAYESPYGATVITPGDNNVIYVATEASGLEDGTSWENATSNLQLAINRAAAYDSNPQVWVKAGTYTSIAESNNFLTMAEGVEVYGGFAGTETSLEQRDISANKTILDGGNSKRVIYQNDDFTSETITIFDGFVIQNGNINENGGGVYMRDYSVLRNCIVRNNTGNRGSAIYTYGYANIINCLIVDNTSTYNSTNASSVFLLDSTLFVNNTVVNNTSVVGTGGVYVDNSKVRIYNSILWGNKKGEEINNIEGQVPDMRFTAVEGGYAGIGNIPLASENTGNAGYYPCFNDIENDDYSLTANSICINKGSSALMSLSSIDLANDERIKQGTIDMGAYESDHTPVINIVPGNNNVIYVATNASGKKDGSSWSDATSDIHLAVNLANTFNPPADVWVKAGTYYGLLYTENAFEMIPGVKVYGGFAGTESSLNERDFRNNVTILDANNTRRVLNQAYNFTSKTLAEWNGFTIRNGNTEDYKSDYEGAGVRMRTYSNIKNSTIINNNSKGDGAIYVQGENNNAYDTIANCIIQSNYSRYAGGIYASYYVYIVNSLITNNSSTYDGGGLYVTNNVKLINNTIANNASERGTGGLYVYSSSNSLIRNNIIWGNKNNGISDQIYISYSSGVMEYNAIEGGYEGTGNITLESANSGLGLHPEFVNPTSGAGSEYSGGDWSLSQNSICINKGTTDNITLPMTDLAGNERVQHEVVDMGAYESSVESSFDIVPDANNIIYVKVNGTGDGSSWADAASDLQFAITRAGTLSPKPTIWVAKGTYRSNADGVAFCMSKGVSIYGGFAGDESYNYDLSQRDFVTNATVLDGMNTRRVILQTENYNAETAIVIDGFTIKNGYDDSSDGGAAAYLRNYSTLRNCQIYDNVSERYAGAVRISGSNSLIENCVIRNNKHLSSWYGGGGVYLSNAKIINSKITDNESNGQGGGIYASGGSVINCLVSNNWAKMSGGIYGSPSLVLNTTIVNNASEHEYANDYAGLNTWSTEIVNCIVWGNTHQGEYAEIMTSGGSVSHSAIHGGYEGTNNINIEIDNDGDNESLNYIRFIDAEHDVYELTDNSVAVDAGYNGNVNITEYDLNGKERVKDGTVDMGAFEQHCVKYRYIAKTMGIGQSMSFYGMTITEPGRYEKRWSLDASCDSLVVMDVRVNSAIFYVTTTGAGLKDGSSWDNAADNINTAVMNAYNSTGFDNKQVWVAAGTYAGNNSGVTFPMVAGVEVYGGFTGTETLFAQRDVENNKTILTGNSSYGVLGASIQYPATAELPSKWDGFYINSGQKIVITENNILQNSVIAILAEVNGGLLQDCTFENVKNNNPAIKANSSTIKNCRFINNDFGNSWQSLIVLENSTLDSCQVYANSMATSMIKATRSNIVKSNIFNNTVKLHSSDFEGVVKASDNSTISHTNLLNNMVTFTYTSITSHFDGDEDYYHQYKYAVVVLRSSTLKNSILWNNAISSFDNNFISKDKNSSVDYCAIDGALYNGIGNIRLTSYNEGNDVFSPCFVNPIYDIGNLINQDTYDWSLKQNSICLGHDENGGAIGAMPSDYQKTLSINPTDNVIYVSAEGSGLKDGSSWSNATPYLQYAVAQANTFDPIAEVWVKAGTYFGDGIVGNNAFNIVENVKVYGGFAGTETSVEERDLENNKTILDGQNLQRVLFQNEPFADGGTTLWDGFTIANGSLSQADFHSQNSVYCKVSNNCGGVGLYHLVGAGAVLLDNTTIRNMIFDNNKIEIDASIESQYSNSMMANTLAMIGSVADSITIVNATTPSCNATQYKNAYLYAVSSMITNSTFKNNAGKIFAYNSVLDHCEISENQSLPEMPEKENYTNMNLELFASTVKNSRIHNNKGVAVSRYKVNGTQYANTFINTFINDNEGLTIVNHALESGDKFINCNIVGNSSTNTSSSYFMISGGDFHNTVVWNNRNGIGVTFDFDRNNLDKYSFNNCAVELGLGDDDEVIALSSNNAGTSQAYGYPEFISPEGGDYDLAEGSALIDAGDNSVVTEEYDIQGRERIGEDIVDIGAIESGCVLKREYDAVTMLSQYPFYDQWLTEPGTYIYRKEIKNSECDSIIVLNLTFKRITYVDTRAKGLNNGSSWENAYTDLKMACDSINTDDGYLNEIWVAKGNYKGDGTSVNAFVLQPNVHLYGGLTGTELANYDLSLRDIEANETVLDGGYIQRVVYMEKDATEETPVIIDGFTIMKGFSRQDVNDGTALELKKYFHIRNCVITDNRTFGGVNAINIVSADVNNCNLRQYINTFENCKITGNQGKETIHSENTAFINCEITDNDGVGVEILTYTKLENCEISNNGSRALKVLWSGKKFTDEMGIERYALSHHDVINTVINNNVGGVYLENPKEVGGLGDGFYYNTIVSNNKLSNSNDPDGAAFRKIYGDIRLYNCTVINNTAMTSGGAMYGIYDEIVNTIFNGNKANSSIDNFSDFYYYYEEFTGALYKDVGYSNLRYCAVEGGYPGEGNINLCSDFPLAMNGNILTNKSVCVNAGTSEGITLTEYDVKGNSRVRQGRVDIGAVESDYTGTTLITPDANNVIYVSTESVGEKNGSSWENATSQLQTAMNLAMTMDPQPEIWMKKGSYTFTDNNAWSMLSIMPGTKLYGGFIGDENPASFDKDDRDLFTNKTILDAKDQARFIDQITDFDNDKKGVIDGFTIKNGNAEAVYVKRIPSSVTSFPDEYVGGAIRLKDNVTVTNCDIYNNVSDEGGAIYANNSSEDKNISISYCKIHDNYAHDIGGALSIHRDYIWMETPQDSIINCEISNNKSDRFGGMDISMMRVIGSTVVSNNSEMYSYDTLYSSNRNNEYYNSIIWGNVGRNYPSQIEGYQNKYAYCAIHGGYTGEGNINLDKYNSGEDPNANYVNFVNPENRAYQPMNTSVVIDEGNNQYAVGDEDLAGKDRFLNSIVDIGAYEAGCINYKHLKIIINEQYVFYSDTLRESGFYSRQWTPDGHDCDSLVTLDLEVRKIWYVTPTGAGDKSGSSWDNAMSNLQDAINAASAFVTDAKKQIWVKKGTYMGNGSSVQAFQIKPGVEIYGGFSGTELYGIEFDERDLVENETILSGANSQRVIGNYSAYSNFTVNDNAVIDGFTIKDGYNTKEGGGVYIRNFVKIRNCIIKDNQGGKGAGIYADNKCEITDCKIFSNTALTQGGGVYCKSSTLTYCEINNNLIDNIESSAKYGGGIYGENATINNCLIANNSVLTDNSYGGGMYIGNSTLPSQLLNCTVVNNFSYYLGGGVYSSNYGSNNEFINCIMWGNKTDLNTQQVAVSASNVPIYVRYCAIQGGAAGIGTIKLTAENGNDMFSPRFVNPTEQVGANYWGGDWRIKEGSICVNMGERLEYMIEQDLDDAVRVRQDRIDIGAYETDYTNDFAIYPDENNIIYVKKDNAGSDMTGSSWNNAIDDLQLALNFAADDDNHPKVWIAKGTYIGNGWPYVDAFIGLNGIDIYGGFAGNEAHDYDISQRDLVNNATILDGQNIQRTLHQAHNTHFKYSLDPMHYAIYDGLTIRNGFVYINGGGNVYMRKGELRNVIIENGTAIIGDNNGVFSNMGGAGILSDDSDVIVMNAIIRNNKAINAYGGGYYGGMTFKNTLFNNNSAVEDAEYKPIAAAEGGAGYSDAYNKAEHYNSTIVNNFATNKCGGVMNYNLVINSIIWGNKIDGNVSANIEIKAPDYYYDDDIRYTAVEGGILGEGNITLNEDNSGSDNVNYPMFVSPTPVAGSGNYGAGDWRLQDGSVCVNRGTITTLITDFDLDGNDRILNDSIDMGAYESNFEINHVIIPDANNIIYVTTEGAGTKDGSSWANSTPYLQFAMDNVYRYEGQVKIWIAKGTYRGNGVATNPAFLMSDRIEMYGGFAGNETANYDLSLRDLEANATIFDGQDLQQILRRDFPSSISVSRNKIDGITFKNARSSRDGAALYAKKVDVVNSIFTDNTHLGTNGGGGAIYMAESTVRRSQLLNNHTFSNGGAIYSESYTDTISHCLIRNNTAEINGGGIYSTSVKIYNTELSYNTAKIGGAVYGTPMIVNSTIVNNNADNYREGYYGGGLYLTNRNCKIYNTIVWGNRGGSYVSNVRGNTQQDFQYSACERDEFVPSLATNIILETSNTGDDISLNYVAFVNPDEGEFQLMEDSDCIDRGNNEFAPEETYDLAGNERLRGTIIDMGAYEQYPASCQMVSNLSVPEEMITFTTADVTWTPGGEESEWIVYYDRVGANSPKLMTVDSNYITLDNLSPNIEYCVKVRAKCSENDHSSYSNMVNFTTVCHPDSVVWVNRFETANLLPENDQALQSNSEVLFSWDHIEGAESYELWLWRADDGHGLAIPDFPVAYNITNNYYTVDLRRSVYQGFGKYPRSFSKPEPPGYLEQTPEEDIAYYAWKVVAYRECAAIETDTMYFNTALPDLHVTSMECSYAQTGQPMTVEWTVRNDGHGPTPVGEIWHDYIVLSYPINWTEESFTQVPYESFIMEAVPNLTALDVGESYTNSTTIFVPDDMYGSVLLFVLSNWRPGTELQLDFAQYGGVPPYPYTPNLYGDGKPYGFMSGNNDKCGNASFEEINGQDAFFYEAIEVDIPPIPDLIATNVIPPYVHFAGDTITITWELTNQGGAAFEDIPVTDNVYMSTENVFNSNARMIGAYRDTISLGRDETITRVAYFPTDEKDVNTYYFFVETDVRNQVYESLFEDNNISSASEFPTDFMLVPPADLTVENLTISKETLSPNEKFNISYTVKNVGFKNTGLGDPWTFDTCGSLPKVIGKPWRDIVYISTEPEFDIANAKQLTSYNNNKVLWTETELENIADTIDAYVWCKYPEITPPDTTEYPELWNLYLQEVENQNLKREALRHEKMMSYINSYTIEKEVLIPEEYDGGTYYIYVVTDQGDNIFEHNFEDNNIVSGTTNVVLPDLMVYDLELNETRDEITFMVKNIGRGQVIDGLITTAVNYNNAEIEYAVEDEVNLSPNDSLFMKVPINLECNFYVDNTLKVDSRLIYLETTFTNNNQTIDLQLYNPDFLAHELILPSTQLGSGQTFQITYSIDNNGDVAFNDDVNIKYYLGLSPELNFITAEELLSKQEYINLEVDETMTITENITLPISADGLYYLYVSVNDDESVCEGDNTYTNYIVSDMLEVSLSPYPDFVVTQVSLPDHATAGSMINMSYTVENRGVRDALPSENWVDKVYLSSEPQFDEDKAVLVGMKERKGYLNVNDIYTETMKIGIPANVMTSQYVYVVTDANDDVFEYIGENNNVYQSPIISIELYDCDLKAVSLTCANTLQWGQNVSMDYKISNAGTSETTAHIYYHAVYLSQDEKLDSEDIELATINAKKLDGGDSESGTVGVRLPYGMSGNAYILLVADVYSYNPDVNIDNNILAKTVTLENVPVPDLVIGDVTLVTEYPAAGQPILIAYTVTNNGDGTVSTSWKDKVYYSRNTFANATLGETLERSISLAPGESYSDTTNVIIPLPNTGNYAIYIDVNASVGKNGERSFFEMDYENNRGMQAVNVDFNPPGDLIVDAISHPYVVTAGDDMTITYNIMNLGPNVLEGFGCNDVFYLSTDYTFSPDDILLGNVEHEIVLPNYSYEEYDFTANISGVPEGEYYIIIYTDARNAFHEVDEENNRAYSAYPFEVQVPELFVDTPITFKLKDLVHKDFKFNVYGNINETVRIHLSSPDAETGAVNNIYVKYNSMGSNMDYDLSSDGDMEGNSEVYIPATKPGYYGVSVLGNDPVDGEQMVTIEANILPFEIRAVEDNVGGNTGKMTVKLIGSKFRYDMPVKLFMGSPEDSTIYNVIEADTVYYVNFNEVFVTFNLEGAEEGVYSIEAYNYCAGFTYLMDCFMIVPGLPENLATNLIIPEGLRQNRHCILTLEYGNIGNTDIVNPVLKLCSIGGSWIGLERGEINIHKTELDIPTDNEEEPEGILRPGVRHTVSIYCFTNESLEFVIYSNEEVHNYEQLKDEIIK
ncbi:MAG: right-handed parallel beta-helix repeat-containing protein [Bacteroidales bacterium]|nr:right-handed parallel beta-helix repeat-containing protein [Bacteroidales bacterium]